VIIEEVRKVFSDVYLSRNPPVPEEVELLEILGCEVNKLLQVYNKDSPFDTALYKDGTTWKAAVWDLRNPYRLVTATSLHSLKVKLELL